MATNVPRQSIPNLGFVALAAGGLIFLVCGMLARYECRQLVALDNSNAMSIAYVTPVEAGCTFDTAQAMGDVEILNSEFGIYSNQNHGFSATTAVPYKVGQEYGWRLDVGQSNRPVSWVEEITVPGVPQTWGGPSRHRRVTADGLTCYTWFNEYPRNGILSNSWMVAAGDPKGTYITKVYIDNELVRTFEFEVK